MPPKNKKNNSKKQQKKKGGGQAGPSRPSAEDLAGKMGNLGLAEPKMSIGAIKAIILFMEASYRDVMANKCPNDFGKWDRLVPQRIQLLTVNSNVLRINHMVHRFQTRSHFPKLPVFVIDGPSDRYGNPLNEKLPRNQHLKDGDILIERPDGDPQKGRYMYGASNTVPMGQFLERATRNLNINQDVLIRLGRVGKDNPIDLTTCFRNLLDQIFGGPRVHFCRHLIVEIDEGILRFPKGLQLKIQRLGLPLGNVNRVLTAIEPLIHPSSYPLDWLTVLVESPRDPFFRNQTLGPKFAGVELCLPDVGGGEWYKAVCYFKHPHFHLSKTQLMNEDWLSIVQDWILRPRPFGYRFSMTTNDYDMFAELMMFQFRGSQSKVAEFGGGPPAMCVSVQIPGTDLDLVASKQQYESWNAGVMSILDKVVVEVLNRP